MMAYTYWMLDLCQVDYKEENIKQKKSPGSPPLTMHNQSFGWMNFSSPLVIHFLILPSIRRERIEYGSGILMTEASWIALVTKCTGQCEARAIHEVQDGISLTFITFMFNSCIEYTNIVSWLVLVNMIQTSHLRRRILTWENSPARLACGQVYGGIFLING